jgi:hypothetical protein
MLGHHNGHKPIYRKMGAVKDHVTIFHGEDLKEET